MNLLHRILIASVMGATAFNLNTNIAWKLENGSEEDRNNLKIITPLLAIASIYFLRQGVSPLAGGLGIGACVQTVGCGMILYSSLALITQNLIPKEKEDKVHISNDALKILNALTSIAIGVYAVRASAPVH